jgi:hypothetical protein
MKGARVSNNVNSGVNNGPLRCDSGVNAYVEEGFDEGIDAKYIPGGSLVRTPGTAPYKVDAPNTAPNTSPNNVPATDNGAHDAYTASNDVKSVYIGGNARSADAPYMELAIYTLSGVLLIFMMEQLLKVGIAMKR